MLTKVTKEQEQLTILLVGQQKKMRQAERILKGYELMLENYLDQFKKRQKTSFVVEELILYQRFLGRLNTDIENQQGKILKIKEEIKQIREKLIEKNKEKKVLEKIEAADYQEYIQIIERAEQRFLDELATINYNRQAR